MQVFVLTFLSDCDQIHDRRHVAARVPDRPRAQGVQCDHAGRSTRAYVPAKIQNRKTVSFCYAGTINTDVLFGLTKKALASRPDLKLIVTSATLQATKCVIRTRTHARAHTHIHRTCTMHNCNTLPSQVFLVLQRRYDLSDSRPNLSSRCAVH